MKKNYENAPQDISAAIEQSEAVLDFLPSPSELLRLEKKKRITLTLTEESINFFKRQAKLNHVPYQHMMRRVMDLYVERYQEKNQKNN